MLIFAVVGAVIMLVVALAGVITAQCDSDDLRRMGIRR